MSTPNTGKPTRSMKLSMPSIEVRDVYKRQEIICTKGLRMALMTPCVFSSLLPPCQQRLWMPAIRIRCV